MKRFGYVAASVVLVGAAGCGESTEVPLAKVAPVTPNANPPRLQSRGNHRGPSSTSPDVLPGHN